MEFEKADVTRYMYTTAVLVSGVFLERWFTEFGGPIVLALGFGAAGIWFLYYKLVLVAKVEAVKERDTADPARTEPRGDR